MGADGATADPAPARAARVRAFAARVRAVPASIEGLRRSQGELARRTDDLSGGVAALREDLARLEQVVWAARTDAHAGVVAVGDELQRVHGRIDERVGGLDDVVTSQSEATRRTAREPVRDAEAARLRRELGPPATLGPGLSIAVATWNHAPYLPAAIASGLAVLDAVADATSHEAAGHERGSGELLVLDDASTDATAELLADLAGSDDRIRVLRAAVNLGLARARTLLVHAARTTHLLQLDADNTLVPAGVSDLLDVARDTGAALTYGNVIRIDEADRVVGLMSNEAVTPALFVSNYVDALAVDDVAALRRAGGWPTDALAEHVDDWAMLHALASRGEILAFVPVVAGRYRVGHSGLSRAVSDARVGGRRVARLFDPTGAVADDVAAVAAHPRLGVLWASAGARARGAELTPRTADEHPAPVPGRRVLVVAPGGVDNLGDDAITTRGLARVRDLIPDAAVDLVTDGPRPVSPRGDVRWLGCLTEILHGLRVADLDGVGPAVAAAAERRGVGTGFWRPLDPGAYDAAIFLGGGSLASVFSEGLIAPRAVLAGALRAARVPHALSGQGIGPLSSDGDRALVAELLAGAEAVGTRDRLSATIARTMLTDPARVTVTGDEALGLAPTIEPRTGPDRPTLAVTIRRATHVGASDGHLVAWVAAVDAVAAARGWDVLGVALNSQEPEPELATLATLARAGAHRRARWHLLDCADDPGRLVGAMATAIAAAVHSYHAALFALAAGVPAVLATPSPYYAAKAAGLADLAGLPSGVAASATAADIGAGLDAVGAALAAGSGLAGAATAVDEWWAALPDRLAVAAAVSG